MPADRPNVLFVFADQHRHDWLGSNPDVPVRTPNIDQLGDRGVRFANAITPSPLCAPARACLAAGVEYPRSPVTGNGEDFPTDRPTLYRRLRESGYHVTGCGKFDLHKNTYEWGVDGSSRLAEWGFSDGLDVAGQIDAALAFTLDRHPAAIPDSEADTWGLDEALDRVRAGEEPHDPYTAYLAERGLLERYIEKHRDMDGAHTTPLPDYAFQDEWIGRRAMDLLSDLPAGEPWFMQVNFGGPHPPFDVTREMHGWYRDPDVTFPTPTEPAGAEDHQGIRRNYAAKIELIDRWLGQYVARLDDRGELDDTIVIYSSDHGEMLGDRGTWGKQHPEQASVGVPMVVAGPGIEAGLAPETPASVLDLHRTVCDYAGAATDAEGLSLRPLLDGRRGDLDRDCVYSALGDWELVFDGRFTLVERGDGAGSRTLYELTDGGEVERTLDDHAGTVARLEERLDTYRR